MTNSPEIAISELEKDLGLDETDDSQSVMPPPLELSRSEPGKDHLGQSIIDGTIDDDNIDLTEGLEDIYDPDLDILDTSHLQAYNDDINNSVSMIDRISPITQGLEDIVMEIRDKSGINRDIVERAVKLYPALEDSLPPLSHFTTTLTRVNYVEGLEEMSDKQKAIGGIGLVAVVGVLLKVFHYIFKAYKSKGNQHALLHAINLTDPGKLKDHADKSFSLIKELTGKSKQPEVLGKSLKVVFERKWAHVKFNSTAVLTKYSDVSDCILQEKLKSSYINFYHILGGGKFDGIENVHAFNDNIKYASDCTSAITHELDTLLKKLLNDFNSDGRLNAEDFKMKSIELPNGGESLETLKVISETLNKLNSRSQSSPLIPIGNYVKNAPNLSPIKQVDVVNDKLAPRIIKTLEELKRLSVTYSKSGNNDLIVNRRDILSYLTSYSVRIRLISDALLTLRGRSAGGSSSLYSMITDSYSKTYAIYAENIKMIESEMKK